MPDAKRETIGEMNGWSSRMFKWTLVFTPIITTAAIAFAISLQQKVNTLESSVSALTSGNWTQKDQSQFELRRQTQLDRINDKLGEIKNTVVRIETTLRERDK